MMEGWAWWGLEHADPRSGWSQQEGQLSTCVTEDRFKEVKSSNLGH